MRILHVYSSFYPNMGGVETYIGNISKNLTEHDFEIITDSLKGYPLSEKYEQNVLIKRFPPHDCSLIGFNRSIVSKILFPYMIYADTKRYYNKKKYLKDTDFDLIHFHGFGNIGGNCIRLDTLLNSSFFVKCDNLECINKPKLLTIHGLFQKLSTNKTIKQYEDHFIDQFDNIICVDENIYRFVLERYKNNGSKRIYFIPNSVDTNLFNFSKISEEQNLVLGFVGRLEGSRGTKLLYNLMANLPDHVELKIVGGGNKSAIAKFKSHIDASKVKVYLNVKNEEIPNFLNEIDILFNPVVPEGISRITLEAMSCGRPVIMLNRGNRYPVINGETGYIIKEDLDELLILLDNLKNNKTELYNIGVNARSIIENEFSNKVILTRINEIYKELIE